MNVLFDPRNAEHKFLADALGKDGKFPLGWANDDLVKAREDYLVYSANPAEWGHLATLPYDLESPLGVLRGVVEVLLSHLLDAEVEDQMWLRKHEVIWNNLALVFSGDTPATIH